MTNAKIVQTVVWMVSQLTFIKEEGEAVRIVGEYNDDEFDPMAVEVVVLKDFPLVIQNCLRKAEALLDDKIVRALYTLMKAEALVNFLKAIDLTRDYFEYLVVLANNLAAVLSRFSLYEQALEQMRNSMGYLVSFITKDRILSEIRRQRSPDGDIIVKARRMLQRTLLIKLHLRQAVFLNQMGRNGEALESSRQAFTESALLCTDTICVALMLQVKLEGIKRLRLFNKWNNEIDKTNVGKEKTVTEEEVKAVLKMSRSPVSLAEQKGLGVTMNSLTHTNKETTQIFDQKQKVLSEHLKQIIPIGMELKKRLECLHESIKSHKKMAALNRLIEMTKNIEVGPLNVSYLYSKFLEDNPLFHKGIIDLIKLDFLQLKDLDFEIDKQSALNQVSSQSFVEKISWLTISLYSMAIEKSCVEANFSETALSPIHSRLPMKSKQGSRATKRGIRVPDSEVDLGKALELAYLFLSEQMPWVIQIYKMYEKTKNAASVIKPEDEEVNDKVRYLKPLRGGYKTQSIIPIVRQNGTELRNTYYDKTKYFVNGPGQVKQKFRAAVSANPHTGEVKDQRKVVQFIQDSKAFNIDLTFLHRKPKRFKPGMDQFKDNLIVDATQILTAKPGSPSDKRNLPDMQSKLLFPVLSEQYSKNSRSNQNKRNKSSDQTNRMHNLSGTSTILDYNS